MVARPGPEMTRSTDTRFFSLNFTFMNSQAESSCPVRCAVVGLLMVSRFPTYSFKGVRVPGRLVLPMLIVVGLLVASLVSKPWTTLGVVIFAYMGSFALSYRSYRRYQKSAEAEKAAVAETDGTRMAEN